MQGDPVALLRQVLADQPHAGEVVIHLDDPRVVATPGAGDQVGGEAGKAETRQRLHFVSADEATLGIEPRLVLDDARHLRATLEVHPARHDRVDRPAHVPHEIAAHLTGRVGHPVRILRRRRVQQQTRRLHRVAGDEDGARLLFMVIARLVGIDHAGDRAARVVGDAQRHAFGPQLEMSGRLRLRDLGVERRPFRADGAACHAEADLMARRPPVARLGIDRHVAAVELLVADALRARGQHFVVVVAGQPRDAVRAGDAELVLGLVVERLEFLEAQRPVQQVGALDLAVDRARLELVFLEAQRGAGPVHGGAADRLADPERQAGIERAGADALVEPAQPAEHRVVVVDDVAQPSRGPASRQTTSMPFCASSFDECAAAGAGADHHNDGVVLQIKCLGHGSFPPQVLGSQPMSSKPRSM